MSIINAYTSPPDIADTATLARRLRQVHESRRLSQGELAASVGIDQSGISRLEQGSILSPGLHQIALIAQTLQIDFAVLIAADAKAFDQQLARMTADDS